MDELLATRGLRTPFLRVAQGGRTLPDRQFTQGGGIGAGVGDQISDDKVMGLFAEGATIVLQGLHRSWAPLLTFSQDLAADLGHPVQVNAYITPAQNQGFSDHYDVHDVFVMQVHGTKRWIIHDPVLRDPMRDEPWAERAEEVAQAAQHPPLLDIVLEPGDCLYLPRGYIHAAKAQGGVTAHLTIGIQQWTAQHVAESMLGVAKAHLRNDGDLRRSLPLGVDLRSPADVADQVDQARAALIRAIEQMSPADLASSLAARARDAQRAEPVRPLAQLAAAEELTPADVLRPRAHAMADLSRGDSGETYVRSRTGRVTVPAELHPALMALMAAPDGIIVADLDSDPERAVTAGREFLRRGIAVSGSR